MAQDFSLSVLGPVNLERAGPDGTTERVPLRPKERAVLAAIGLHHPRPSTTDRIVDLIWPDAPPATARKAVQNHVLRIRRAAGDGCLDTVDGAYTLGPHVGLDTDALTSSVGEAATAQRQHDRALRRRHLEAALECFGGEPFTDLPESPETATARRRLGDLRADAEEGLADALVGQDLHHEAIELLTDLTEDQPYRERRWWLLMLAQYRAGRRRDALATFAAAREKLVTGAGIEPGDDLRRLERLIATDDPALMTPAILHTGPGIGVDAAQHSEQFVGRDAEMERLTSLFEEVLRGSPRFAVLEGESGIGKTTLAHEFGARVGDRARVVWGPCDAAPTTPLQPFGRALDELIEAEGSTLPVWLSDDPAPLAAIVPRLAERLDARPDDIGDAGRYRLFDAVADALVAAAAQQPLVVILDDFHLTPPTTRRLVSRCLESRAPLLLLATWRATPGSLTFADATDHDLRAEVVTLGGLPESAVIGWLRSTVGNDQDVTDVAHWVHWQTGGNPLFVRELTAMLLERGTFDRDRTPSSFQPPEGVPDALREVLLDRVRGLAADTVAFLRAASVLGTRFRPRDLKALVDASPSRQIAEATRAGILRAGRSGDEVEFTHDLLRRALYDTLSEGARIELHDLAAQAAESDEHPDDAAKVAEIAWHRLAAAPIDPLAAVTAARRAGDAAMELYAFDEAARFYEGARATADSEAGRAADAEADKTRCELTILRGDALRRAGDPANVDLLTDAAECAESLGDADLLTRAALGLCQLGATTEAGDTHQRAAHVAERALEIATSPHLRAEVAGAASLVLSLSGRPERCRELFERAEREARSTGDPEVLGAVLPYAYLALAEPGDLDRRSEIAQEVLRLGTRRRHLPTEWEGHQLAFSVQLVRGDPAFSDSYGELAALTDVVREPTRMWAESYLGAVVAHVRGELDRAETLITESLEFAGPVAPSRVLATYGAELLGLRAQQQRLGELADTVSDLVDEQPGLPAWHAALAWIAAANGDTATAIREFDLLAADDFAMLPRDFTWTAGMYALGKAVAGVGDPVRARVVLRALEPHSGLMSWFGTGTYGPLDQVVGECAATAGDTAAARRHLGKAGEMAQALGAPLFEAEATAALAQLPGD